MLNVSTFGNTADIYAIVHLVPHACQHITVDQSHSSGDTVAKILEISGEWRHKDRVLHKPPEEKIARGWVVYLLRIFKMFHGLMNNPVFLYFVDETLSYYLAADTSLIWITLDPLNGVYSASFRIFDSRSIRLMAQVFRTDPFRSRGSPSCNNNNSYNNNI